MMNILKLLFFQGSRKVGLGLWLFFASIVLLCLGKIAASDWMMCMGLSSALVGGGTVADAWMKNKTEGAKNAVSPS